MNVKVQMCCSRSSGGRDNEAVFNLTVRDELSGVEFLDVSMTAEQFVYMLTAHVTGNIKAEVRGLKNIGKVLETKEVVVPFTDRYISKEEDRDAIAAAALKPYEVDGWTGRRSDLFNHHRTVGAGNRVVFQRHVAERKEGA